MGDHKEGDGDVNAYGGLYIVDLRSMELSAEQYSAIEKAIQSAVLASLAVLDVGSAKRGMDRIGGGSVMGFI